jgi:hypothetical protein
MVQKTKASGQTKIKGCIVGMGNSAMLNVDRIVCEGLTEGGQDFPPQTLIQGVPQHLS